MRFDNDNMLKNKIKVDKKEVLKYIKRLPGKTWQTAL